MLKKAVGKAMDVSAHFVEDPDDFLSMRNPPQMKMRSTTPLPIRKIPLATARKVISDTDHACRTYPAQVMKNLTAGRSWRRHIWHLITRLSLTNI